jgi:predicted aminopeptidase
MNTNSGSFGSLASATPLQLMVLVALCLAVAGCGEFRAHVDQKPAQKLEASQAPEVEKFGPDEHGVMCYRLYGGALSCVKVR